MTEGSNGPATGQGDDVETGAVTVERREPEETFALLGDETRVAILRALDEADEDALTFSQLRERVGTADSGRFNYHLKKLVGSFVRRGDDGDGYTLTLAGRRVVGALVAGTYTATVSIDPIPVDAPCPNCDGRLVLDYADERVRVHCADCGVFRNEFAFPPGTLGQFDREELPEAADRWLQSTFQRVIAGFCTNCGGRVDSRLVADYRGGDGGEGGGSDEGTGHDREPDTRIVYECRQCDSESNASPFIVSLRHPTGVAFFHDHGVDVTTAPTWEAFGRFDDYDVDVVATDPTRARVSVDLDGERLTVDIDPDGRVESSERTHL
ncbi:winged helix-turn-helix domain-containing protein [Halobium salinum]|uniref:Winged helix-turn-helix domain-containing protein n=1 Tax=Halobium salinum TaxID=1364940 RepID=A0ABD5PF16_9EURY|nr:winged helix-turn-helix domain-containing protein [Halobium salinum]